MEEEYILQELTENKSGKLSSLDDLGKYGKVFFYVCTHLLHSIPAYKKRSYKKRLVEILGTKKQ